MSELHCPNCGAALDLLTAFSAEADRKALERLVALSVPLGARVLHYLGLHQPAKQRLTAAKKIKLLLQLLPDLERRAITHKGRDWQAPLPNWAAAIDQMLAMRDAQRLELPLKGHGYLYAVIAGMADKHEAQQERQHEQARVDAARTRQHGQSQSVADALQIAASPTAPRNDGGAAASLRAQRGNLPAPGTSPTVLKMKAEIARKKGLAP